MIKRKRKIWRSAHCGSTDRSVGWSVDWIRYENKWNNYEMVDMSLSWASPPNSTVAWIKTTTSMKQLIWTLHKFGILLNIIVEPCTRFRLFVVVKCTRRTALLKIQNAVFLRSKCIGIRNIFVDKMKCKKKKVRTTLNTGDRINAKSSKERSDRLKYQVHFVRLTQKYVK